MRESMVVPKVDLVQMLIPMRQGPLMMLTKETLNLMRDAIVLVARYPNSLKFHPKELATKLQIVIMASPKIKLLGQDIDVTTEKKYYN